VPDEGASSVVALMAELREKRSTVSEQAMILLKAMQGNSMVKDFQWEHRGTGAGPAFERFV